MFEKKRFSDLARQADKKRDQHEWSEASHLYEQYLGKVGYNQNSFNYVVQLGNCLKEAGQLEQSLAVYDIALSINKNNADLYIQRGHAQKMRADFQAAFRSYKIALKIDPENVDAKKELNSGIMKIFREINTHGEEVAFVSTLGQPSAKSSHPKVLYISDSLGTPIHPRGIFNYSMSIVTMLKSLGAEVTLLVERADGYGFPPFCHQDEFMISALQSSSISEIYRYYNTNLFGFEWSLNDKIRSRVKKDRKIQKIYNKENIVDFKPKKGKHLDVFDAFLWADYIYSDSMCYAVNNLDPININAEGYDYVFVDTPHYMKVTGIDSKNIFCVVHDLIPFRDPTMSWDWRTLFMQKMRATIKMSANMIFVSKYTQKLFNEDIKYSDLKSENIIYPTITSKAILASEWTSSSNKSSYVVDIRSHRDTVRLEAIKARLSRQGLSTLPETDAFKALDKVCGYWDGNLPHFCTVVSDEPRKNIDLIVKASKHFQGRANFLVIGQVDGNRYMENEPEFYPNLHFTGFIENHHKNDIIKHAHGLVFPSFAEGFGIPVIEGALYSVPVLCSDIEVFREITNGEAIYFDPYSVSDFNSKINKLIEDKSSGEQPTLRKFVIDTFSQATMEKKIKALIN